MNWQDYMMNSQKEVMISNDALLKELEHCMTEHEKTYKQSIIKLGTINEQGETVRHGCNMCINVFVTYWSDRIRAIHGVLRSYMTPNERNETEMLYPNFNFSTHTFTKEYNQKLLDER